MPTVSVIFISFAHTPYAPEGAEPKPSPLARAWLETPTKILTLASATLRWVIPRKGYGPQGLLARGSVYPHEPLPALFARSCLMSTDPLLKEKSHWSSIVAFTAGIASVLLWEFSLIPILAIIFGIIGLVRDKKKWMAATGLVLGVIFLVVRISHGQMRGIFSNIIPSSNGASQTSSAPTTQTPVSGSSATASSKHISEQEDATCKRLFGATAYLRNASTGYCGYSNDPTNEVLVPPGVTPPSTSPTDSESSSSVGSGAMPTTLGQCSRTTVLKTGTRLTNGTTGQDIAGSGSSISYTNGGYQVAYDTVPGIENSRPGDAISICLVFIPKNCPPGDNRGKEYTAVNLRTGESWRAGDSGHSCGGA